MSENKALRYNNNKRKWSLLHYKSLEPIIKVLEYGAKKYSVHKPLNRENLITFVSWEKEKLENVYPVIEILELLPEDCVKLATLKQKLENVPFVEKLEQLFAKECVIPAIISKKKESLQNLEKNSKNIEKDITEENQLNKEREIEVNLEELIQSIKKQRNIPDLSTDFQNMESPKIFTIKNVNEVAKYVEAKKGCILITIIKLENSEEFFVVNATTELDCLIMIFHVLKKLSYISKEIFLEDDILKVDGRNNWQKGLNDKEILESAQRHIASMMDNGVDNLDEESGLPELGHLGCNYLFLAYNMLKRKGLIK